LTHIGAGLRNETGRRITSLALRYTAKQWNTWNVPSSAIVPFSFSLNATNLTSGFYTIVPALGMRSFKSSEGYAVLNGNEVVNQQLIKGTISDLAWEPGADLWIRWSSGELPTPLITIDDFTLVATPEIRVRRSNPTSLALSWPTNFSGFNLQTADDPGASSWEPVPTLPAISDGENVIHYDASGGSRFFRLQGP
jgi:hypothetical protein